MERGQRKEKPLNRLFCELIQDELSKCWKHENKPYASWIYICRMMGGELFRVPANREFKRDKIIKALEKNEYTPTQIAERYGVSKTYIWQIKKTINKNNKK